MSGQSGLSNSVSTPKVDGQDTHLKVCPVVHGSLYPSFVKLANKHHERAANYTFTNTQRFTDSPQPTVKATTLQTVTHASRAVRTGAGRQYKEKLIMMTIGKFKGTPLTELATPYLMWLISNDHIRHGRWELTQTILLELRRRFADFDNLIESLAVTEPPAKHWQTPEQIAAKAASKAEKLKALEQRRAEEKQAKAVALRTRHANGIGKQY